MMGIPEARQLCTFPGIVNGLSRDAADPLMMRFPSHTGNEAGNEDERAVEQWCSRIIRVPILIASTGPNSGDSGCTEKLRQLAEILASEGEPSSDAVAAQRH